MARGWWSPSPRAGLAHFAHSGDDEYGPAPSMSPPSALLVAAAGGAANGAEAVIIAGANHNLATSPAAADDFVACVSRVLSEVCSP